MQNTSVCVKRTNISIFGRTNQITANVTASQLVFDIIEYLCHMITQLCDIVARAFHCTWEMINLHILIK